MEENGFSGGDINYEVADENGEYLATLTLAWPEGIQQGLSEPVAFLMDEDEEVHRSASKHGFKYFDDVEEFKNYVNTTYRF